MSPRWYLRPKVPHARRIEAYTHNGDRFFVVDGHIHFWDASPANWVSGQEQYAKGWIECFHAYMSLAPEDTHWPIEKFQKYSEKRTSSRTSSGTATWTPPSSNPRT